MCISSPYHHTGIATNCKDVSLYYVVFMYALVLNCVVIVSPCEILWVLILSWIVEFNFGKLYKWIYVAEVNSVVKGPGILFSPFWKLLQIVFFIFSTILKVLLPLNRSMLSGRHQLPLPLKTHLWLQAWATHSILDYWIIHTVYIGNIYGSIFRLKAKFGDAILNTSMCIV